MDKIIKPIAFEGIKTVTFLYDNGESQTLFFHYDDSDKPMVLQDNMFVNRIMDSFKNKEIFKYLPFKQREMILIDMSKVKQVVFK